MIFLPFCLSIYVDLLSQTAESEIDGKYITKKGE